MFEETINFYKLNEISNLLRYKTVKTSHEASIPHLGSCLSCVEILVYLYWIELNLDPLNCNDQDRDRFILSKGHGAPILFQVLAERGFYDKNLLKTAGKNGSLFHEHPPKPGYIPGIEAATGSLGHGLPIALGIAMAGKIKKKSFRTFALLSDGECNEGTIWESAMFASSKSLSRVTAIIDFNKWQATGRTKEIMSLEPLLEKWKSFGWHAQEINGHNFAEIKDSLDEANSVNDKPSVIIANTIKGKGVSFMEDNNNWHYKIPNEEELSMALSELTKNKK